MNKNRIDGAGRKAAGTVKEAAGKAIGNPGMQVRGAAEKAAGSIQNAAGKAQDKLDGASRRP